MSNLLKTTIVLLSLTTAILLTPSKPTADGIYYHPKSDVNQYATGEAIATTTNAEQSKVKISQKTKAEKKPSQFGPITEEEEPTKNELLRHFLE